MKGPFLSLVSFPVFLLPAVLAVAVFLTYVLSRKIFFDRYKKRQQGGEEKSEVGFVVDTFQDLVSKLKENERELKELRAKAEKRADLIENLSKNILESVPSGVISFNEALEITMVNSAAERIMGFKREETIGRKHNEVLKGDIARLIEKNETVSRQELAFYPGIQKGAGMAEGTQSRENMGGGRRLWVGFSVTPLRDAAGARIGLILVFTDLTQLKALERQAELRRRLSSLGEMSAGLAHELRNPMAVISGYSKMLSKIPAGQASEGQTPAGQVAVRGHSDVQPAGQVVPAPDGAGKEKISEMQRQAALAIEKEVAAMNSIINGFLSFANPGTPAFETLDRQRLAGILKTCLDAALAGVAAVRASLSVCEEGFFTIKADEILLKQTFMNLIQNAVQAMAPEGGRLDIDVCRKENEVLISVADTGPGIPEQMRQKVFLPFYTSKEGGMGLGLAIVHSIIQSHFGSIEVESSGEGATFLIKLPVSE
ncbi:MAG: ATP-binding protein [Nitrospiraceae bacterium]|nr:ATP-binding protein [Nitrospiraceae bacterium]